jgi:hypothetical protein
VLEPTELDQKLEEVTQTRIGLRLELAERAERLLAGAAIVGPRTQVEDACDRTSVSHASSQRGRSPVQ